MDDMTLQQATAKATALRERLGKAQQQAQLGAARSMLNDVGGDVAALPGHIAQLRSRGWAWDADAEPMAQRLGGQWPAVAEAVRAAIERESQRLSAASQQFGLLASSGIDALTNPYGSGSPADAERAIQSIETAVSEAEAGLRRLYGGLDDEVRALGARLDEARRMLDLAGETAVRLGADEALLLAVRAKWDRDGKDDPRGVLLLTDQRLVFERNEEIATKKTLFIVTEKKRVQEVMLQVPFPSIAEVVASARGLLGHEDHLDLSFGPDADARRAHFHIDGHDSHAWEKRAKSLRNGELRRAGAPDAGPGRVPERCPACHAPIKQQLARGQTQVKCEYCGTVIQV